MPADLDIVIVSWNTRDLLADCLASLGAASESLAVNVVIVDNGSTDGTVEMIRDRFPEVDLIVTGTNLGFTRANNLALARAEAPRILLLNPDTVCPPGSLRELCDTLDRLPRAAAVGPAQRDGRGRPTAAWGEFPRPLHSVLGMLDPGGRWLPARWRGRGLGSTAETARNAGGSPDPRTGAVPVDYIKGACFLMRREALERIGPLDERFFMYFEETDWCWRARAAGWQIYLCPDVTITHLEGRAAEQVSQFALRQFELSYRLYLAKHHGGARAMLIRSLRAAEYYWKALLRSLAPGDRPRNRRLAAVHAARARLQWRRRITVSPPQKR